MIINGVRLGDSDISRLKNSAKIAQKLENEWDRKIAKAIKSSAALDADRISAGGEIVPPDFDALFVEHYFAVKIAALELAVSERELSQKHLASGPRSLREIMRLYDAWRRGVYKPKGPLKRAKEIKKKYVDAVQRTWKKYSEDFRHGGAETQTEIVEKVQEAAETTTARAQTIVRTETTRYYNDARRAYYDQGDEVTHYLFVAVRDKATTPWCTSQKVNGKRGRSGLVYAKSDPLLDKETPPVHWNCRSELLPLNRFNPVHRKLIADPNAQRRNHVCAELPPGWNK